MYDEASICMREIECTHKWSEYTDTIAHIHNILQLPTDHKAPVRIVQDEPLNMLHIPLKHGRKTALPCNMLDLKTTLLTNTRQ